MPGKYQPLADWLAAQPDTEVLLTFAQVEQILGTPLPASARAGTAWWTHGAPSFPQVEAWHRVGWHVVEVNRRRGLVLYRRLPPGELPALR